VQTKIVPTNIFEQFVRCHATGKSVPKFVLSQKTGNLGQPTLAQKSAVPIYADLKFAQRTSMMPKPESTWIREHQMYKKLSDEDRYRIKEILENDEIQTEELLM